MGDVDRRDFLKAASAAAVLPSLVDRAAIKAAPADVKIASRAYTPREYPIRAQRHADVRIRDGFWQPKIQTNATVTIPIEVAKLEQTPRGFAGNVLEAAIRSLEIHPDAGLQAKVDAAIARLTQTSDRENSLFEVAESYFAATG